MEGFVKEMAASKAFTPSPEPGLPEPNYWVEQEWLIANHLGSFAFGSANRIPGRKYHSLLTVREPFTGDPLNTVMDVAEVIFQGDNRLTFRDPLRSGQEETVSPFLKKFTMQNGPTWNYDFGPIKVERSLKIMPLKDIVSLTYDFSHVENPFTLELTPWILMRPLHELKVENPFLNGKVHRTGDWFWLQTYAAVPRLFFQVSEESFEFRQGGCWLHGIQHSIESQRGYDGSEDCFIAGSFRIPINKDMQLTLRIGSERLENAADIITPRRSQKTPKKESFAKKLQMAGEQFLVQTQSGLNSIIAGYPWFTHWARDTFLAVPGLCLVSGHTQFAKKVLSHYGQILLGSRKHGQVNYSGMDSYFLFIRAVEMLGRYDRQMEVQSLIIQACHLLDDLRAGVDPRIQITDDGEVFTPHGPWASSWMDAVVNGQPVTPRHNFAVDINALFLNAVHFTLNWAQKRDKEFVRTWKPLLEKGKDAFLKRFTSEKRAFLADYSDGKGAHFELRPNQLWAISQPLQLLPLDLAESILREIGEHLLTPVGLRTLAPFERQYQGHYQGDQAHRDRAYHQGTVWPWLLGPYTDSLVAVYGKEYAKKVLQPIFERLEFHMDNEACIGQISEIFDGDDPHLPRGALAQAWSVSEVLRSLQKVNS